MIASTDNEIGISAIGYNCRLIASTKSADGLLENFAYDGMLQLSYLGAEVINVSWVSYSSYDDQIAIIDEIYNNGTLVVAASGNLGITRYAYPASYNHVLSVTGIGHRNEPGYIDPELGPYNWKDRVEVIVGNPEAVFNHNDRVDFCAPGWQITGCILNNSYADLYANGTSLSAPIVAGTCGLMLSVNHCLTPDDLTSILKNTAVNIYTIPENQNYIGMYGAGRLDTYEAVKGAGEYGTIHYSNQTFYATTLSKVGLSFDDNVTMLSSNNLNATYEVRIEKNFYLPLGATLDINVNTSNTINCQ